MTVDQLKAAVCRAIDDHAQKIIDLGESIFREPELGYIKAAKLLAMTVVDLLADGARKGLEVKHAFQAPLTKESYLALLDQQGGRK